jgi:outer membrane protein assembly factor BamC
MKRKLLLMAYVLPPLLAGCSGSMLESKKIEYKSAATSRLPPLEIPPDLTAPTRDDRYAVPDVSPKGTATYSAYAGERAGQARSTTVQEVLPQAEKMRIERSGNQRWLVVQGTPEKLWPGIKEFWQDLGFLVNVELPEAGILETDWAENRAKLPQDIVRNAIGKVFDALYSTPERDKFRTRLEAGSEPGTTEIYISHRGMYEIYVNEGKTETRWQPRQPDPELEAEMLGRLMVRLGVDEVRAKTLVATAGGSRDERARLVQGKDGPSILEVQEPFDRAWRRVGLALDRVGFTVEDRDRSQGLYFVRYVDPEIDVHTKKKDEGFLSKLAFWRSSDKPDVNKNAQFRIHVKGEAGNSSVRVLTREGGTDVSETSRKILGLLQGQLK